MTSRTDASPLVRDQVVPAARLLAAALHDDPAYAFLFREEATRRAGLELFFARHLANHVPHRASFAGSDADGSVNATVTLRPPGGIPVPALRLARGLAALALAQGPGVVRRLLRLRDVYEALEARTAGGRPYWHVHMMAVRPELQGKGIGGALLEVVLDTAASRPGPIVLTTHQEINVRFYLRAGFEVAFRETVDFGDGRPYPVWCMRRDAAPA